MRTIPSPLGIGTITLADGTKVQGFLCEGQAVETAQDITAIGDWRKFLSEQARSAFDGPAVSLS
jgi:allophanate hydrolase